MRTAFIKTLIGLAEKNERIFLLTGDLGFSVLEEFKEKFHGRFINAGIAEANMIGVAAGLALTGKLVYVYSIVPFVTLRCLEQIRNDICYQRLNVRIIGIGGGLSYGTAGGSHYSLEDIAIMRAMPDLAVVAPGDPLETESLIKESINYDGPLYIRLGKGRDPEVHKKIKSFKIGKGILIKPGKDIGIISTGNILFNSLKSAELLLESKIDPAVLSMHTVKPIDRIGLARFVKGKKAVFTVEEHDVDGGLGSAVAEVLSEMPDKINFKRIGVNPPVKILGSQDYLRAKLGLDPKGISEKIKGFLKKWKIKK